MTSLISLPIELLPITFGRPNCPDPAHPTRRDDRLYVVQPGAGDWYSASGRPPCGRRFPCPGAYEMATIWDRVGDNT
ncbi:hypothetical protein GCM10011575_31840 [Microlunatus endophyticus]|uniref:Uncharacterized protein n=1 Tax=Microlunatus endophyticus TaxID=1716077 RepID=A0A917SCS7_9ACTN|nr:hypothetical protein GCM10011575_31840 [Microlunatus endophyticus]